MEDSKNEMSALCYYLYMIGTSALLQELPTRSKEDV